MIGEFVEGLRLMSDFLSRAQARGRIVEEVIMRAGSGKALAGDWSKMKPGPDFWMKLEKAISKAGAA